MKSHSDIELFIRLEPDIPKLTHQNGVKPVHRCGKTFMHKTRELENLEAKYITLLSQYAPDEPWDCPIMLKTLWYFKRPQSQKSGYKTTKPDTDNLTKTFKDCMKTAGFFKDDALVAVDVVAKYWVDEEKQHGIYVRMHDMSNDEV